MATKIEGCTWTPGTASTKRYETKKRVTKNWGGYGFRRSSLVAPPPKAKSLSLSAGGGTQHLTPGTRSWSNPSIAVARNLPLRQRLCRISVQHRSAQIPTTPGHHPSGDHPEATHEHDPSRSAAIHLPWMAHLQHEAGIDRLSEARTNCNRQQHQIWRHALPYSYQHQTSNINSTSSQAYSPAKPTWHAFTLLTIEVVLCQ